MRHWVPSSSLQLAGTTALTLVELAVLVRAILRPHREPASRIAWAVVIVILPVLGVVAYLLIGEVRISLKRRVRGREIEAKLPRPPGDDAVTGRVLAGFYDAPFALGRSINCLPPTGGNRVILATDSNAAIDQMVDDIDAAGSTVHLCAYIWLGDSNGCKIKDALIRAAGRGVTVRAMADALGSRLFIRSQQWRDLAEGGVQVQIALPVGNPLWTFIRGRVDLRNHRKLLIVDNRLAWCGSQNVADPEFRIKPRYAPWVDIMSRWEGPVARHCQYLFVSDWIGDGGDDISASSPRTLAWRRRGDGGVVAQVIGTGPTVRVRLDAVLLCRADPFGAPGAGGDHALFRARRSSAVRLDLRGPPRRRTRSCSCPGATTASSSPARAAAITRTWSAPA